MRTKRTQAERIEDEIHEYMRVNRLTINSVLSEIKEKTCKLSFRCRNYLIKKGKE